MCCIAARARPPCIRCARLLAPVFDIDMQHCPNCGGGELKIFANLLERPVIDNIPVNPALPGA